MKEIVVISGKGGTGKTSVAASFAQLAGAEAIIADCDVDAADMHLLLEPDMSYCEDFYSGFLAVIDADKCTCCGKCAEVCRFDAVSANRGLFEIIPLDCEGCGYCARICPAGAIDMQLQKVGAWCDSGIKSGSRMIHARLGIGAENSGKLVARVKKAAREAAEEGGKDYIIVDGSPGVGCPVVSSLSGADYALLVTEPSISGVHDLKRVYELVSEFKIRAGCVINKYDIKEDKVLEIESFVDREGIDFIGKIPYDEDFTRAMTEGKTIVEYGESSTSAIIRESWKLVKRITEQL